MDLKLEYERDFHQWIEHHIALLREGKWSEIDVEHLVEELKDMGKSNLHELGSRLIVLISHFLKWEYQYHQLKSQWETFNGGSWRGSIKEQRIQMSRLLRKNPSLKRFIPATIVEVYVDTVALAVEETQFPLSAFPNQCPYTVEQLLDEHFYPEPRLNS